RYILSVVRDPYLYSDGAHDRPLLSRADNQYAERGTHLHSPSSAILGAAFRANAIGYAPRNCASTDLRVSLSDSPAHTSDPLRRRSSNRDAWTSANDFVPVQDAVTSTEPGASA